MPERVFRFHDVELDERKREVRRAGSHVEVRPQVFELLQMLARRSGEVVGREDLIETVWPRETVSDGALTNAIYEARLAVGDDGRTQRVIQTVYGRGVRLVPEVQVWQSQTGPLSLQIANPTDSAGQTFVGRSELLRTLQLALEEARSGRGQLVLLEGEEGVGKTSTALHFAERSEKAAISVAHCHADSPPLWAWIQILRDILRGGDLESFRNRIGVGGDRVVDQIATLIRSNPSDVLGLNLHDNQARFPWFDAIAAFLRCAAEDRPLLIVIDDLQEADATTLQMLEFLTLEMERARLLVVGTFSSDEHETPPTLEGTLSSIAKHGHVSRRVLSGLQEDEIQVLGRQLLGRQPAAELVRELEERSDGNPFYIKELLRLMPVAEPSSGESAIPPRFPDVPAVIRDRIRARLREIPEDVRDLLSIASVQGREFDGALLHSVTATSAVEVRDLLEEAEADGLVIPLNHPPGFFRFLPPLLQETLYEDLRGALRGELHRKTADALENHGDPGAAARATYNFHRAADAIALGRTEDAFHHFSEAGREATQAQKYESAAEYFAESARIGERNAALQPSAFREALLALGTACIRAGWNDSARRVFGHAATLARRAKDSAALSQAALGMSEVESEWVFASPSTASLTPIQAVIGLLEEAAEGDRDDVDERALLAANSARWLYRTGDAEGACAALSLAEQIVGNSGSDAARAEILLTARELEQSESQAPEDSPSLRENPEMLARARTLAIAHHIDTGNMIACQRELLALQREVAESGEPRFIYTAAILAGTTAYLEGRPFEAERSMADAVALGRRLHPDPELTHTIHSFGLRRQQARIGEILPDATNAAAERPSDPFLRALLACCYLETGNRSVAARELQRAAANQFNDIRDDSMGIAALAFAGIAAAGVGEREWCGAIYDRLAPFAERNILVAHGLLAYGSVADPLGRLAASLGRWDESQRHFEAALDFNRRLGPVHHAATNVAYAEALLAWDAEAGAMRIAALLDEASMLARGFDGRAIELQAQLLRTQLS